MIAYKYAADYAAVIYEYTRNNFKEVFRFFNLIAKAFEESVEFRNLLFHPALSLQQKVSAATAIGGECPRMRSDIILSMLIGKGHIRYLSLIVEALDALHKAGEGRIAPHVRSAQPLTDNEKKTLTASLGRYTGKTVEPVFESDPQLIAGYEVTIGSLVINNTIQHELTEITQRLNACKQG